eukprot:10098749-Alexandrium_andersonii.AAC.1
MLQNAHRARIALPDSPRRPSIRSEVAREPHARVIPMLSSWQLNRSFEKRWVLRKSEWSSGAVSYTHLTLPTICSV